MPKFSLTINQLEKILQKANAEESHEDILTFQVKNGRLLVTQKDWGHTSTKTLIDKPC